MQPRLETYNIGKATVLGRNFFKPPFKISDALINEARFVYVVNGNSKLYSANTRIEMSPGKSVLMTCDNFVNHWQPNVNDALNEVIVFQLYPDVLNELYNDTLPDFLKSSETTNKSSVLTLQENPHVHNFILNLKYYLDHPEIINEEIIKIKFKELIYLLANSDATGQMKRMLGQLFALKKYGFEEIISSNLYENLNLEDLAFFAGLSLSSFKRKFKAIYGTSPNKYIISKRLEKAQTLLATSDLRISEIAYDCGFNDLSHFSKSFHAAYHCTPSVYRQNELSQ